VKHLPFFSLSYQHLYNIYSCSNTLFLTNWERFEKGFQLVVRTNKYQSIPACTDKKNTFNFQHYPKKSFSKTVVETSHIKVMLNSFLCCNKILPLHHFFPDNQFIRYATLQKIVIPKLVVSLICKIGFYRNAFKAMLYLTKSDKIAAFATHLLPPTQVWSEVQRNCS